MRKETKVITVIRYKDYDDDYVYVASNEPRAYGDIYINESYDIEGAKDFVDDSVETIANVYNQFQDENPGRDCEVVRITTETTIEEIMEDDDTFKELRQKTALAKLTEKEIQALGLTSIAVYVKTKYHNA